jgi:quinol monooxygenase YgiN
VNSNREPCANLQAGAFCFGVQMILATLRMRVGDDQDAVKAFRMLSAHARVQPGNVSCEIHRQVDMPGYLIYVERWRDWEAMKEHLRSETYGQILRILELSIVEPLVEYREVGEPRGLEFVEAVRLDHAG